MVKETFSFKSNGTSFEYQGTARSRFKDFFKFLDHLGTERNTPSETLYSNFRENFDAPFVAGFTPEALQDIWFTYLDQGQSKNSSAIHFQASTKSNGMHIEPRLSQNNECSSLPTRSTIDFEMKRCSLQSNDLADDTFATDSASHDAGGLTKIVQQSQIDENRVHAALQICPLPEHMNTYRKLPGGSTQEPTSKTTSNTDEKFHKSVADLRAYIEDTLFGSTTVMPRKKKCEQSAMNQPVSDKISVFHDRLLVDHNLPNDHWRTVIIQVVGIDVRKIVRIQEDIIFEDFKIAIHSKIRSWYSDDDAMWIMSFQPEGYEEHLDLDDELSLSLFLHSQEPPRHLVLRCQLCHLQRPLLQPSINRNLQNSFRMTKDSVSIIRDSRSLPGKSHSETITGHTSLNKGTSSATNEPSRVVHVSDDGDRHIQAHMGAVYSCSLSDDASRIVSAGRDGKVKLWCSSTLSQLAELSGHRGYVLDCKFAPGTNSDSTCLSCSDDRKAIMWDCSLHAFQKAKQVFIGHAEKVYSCAWAPDVSRIATCSCDGTVRLWDLETGASQRTFASPTGAVFSVVFDTRSPDVVYSGGDGGVVRVYDHRVGGNGEVWTFHGHTSTIWCCSVGNDGNTLVTSSMDHTIRLWDTRQQEKEIGTHRLLNSSQPPARSFSHHSAPVHCAVITPKSTHIISGARDRLVNVFNIGLAKPVRTLVGHSASVYRVDLKQSTLISCSMDGTLRIWNVDESLLE